MEVVLLVILAMFREDNAEFFDASCQNNKNTSWQYVGVQPVDPTRLNLPSINPDTGKETIIFSCQ